jgi:hypothetical protein
MIDVTGHVDHLARDLLGLASSEVFFVTVFVAFVRNSRICREHCCGRY